MRRPISMSRRISPIFRLAFGLAVVFLVGQTSASAAPGGLDEPLLAGSDFPFIHTFSTSGAESAISHYGCSVSTSEEGPEVVYRFEVGSAGRIRAEVEGDDSPIDIDIHLLSALDVGGDGTAANCLARDNKLVEEHVSAGTYYAVVDSYEGAHRAGPYRLRIDFYPDDDFYRREVAEGVVLGTRVYDNLAGADQRASILEVELSSADVTIRALGESCGTTSELGSEAGAVAAINGGFFNMDTCASVSLLKSDNRLIATNSVTRSAIGVNGDGAAMIALIEAGADWPDATEAIGGVPRIVSAGEVDVQVEGSSSSFRTNREPRTAVGIDANGDLILATIDGRSSASAGVSLNDLAQWMIDIGSREALNLDGGGSTTLWAAESIEEDGVVNTPSGGTQRRVSSVLGVFAPALDRPPVWLTKVDDAVVSEGDTWLYSAVVGDPEGADVDVAPLISGAAGALLSEAGRFGRVEVSYTPAWPDGWPDGVRLVLEARDGTSENNQQVVELQVDYDDGDGDGLPDTWEDIVGLDTSRDDSAEDPDGDGRDNASELLDGTDPLTSDQTVADPEPDAGVADAQPEVEQDAGRDLARNDGNREDAGISGDPVDQGAGPQRQTVSVPSGCGCTVGRRPPRGAWLGIGLLLGGLIWRERKLVDRLPVR